MSGTIDAIEGFLMHRNERTHHQTIQKVKQQKKNGQEHDALSRSFPVCYSNLVMLDQISGYSKTPEKVIFSRVLFNIAVVSQRRQRLVARSVSRPS